MVPFSNLQEYNKSILNTNTNKTENIKRLLEVLTKC